MFVRSDLKQMSEVQREMSGEVLWDLSVIDAREGDAWWTVAAVAEGVKIPATPSRDAISAELLRDLQQEIRDGLAQLLQGGGWALPLPQAVTYRRFPADAELPPTLEHDLPEDGVTRERLRFPDPSYSFYWEADVRTRVLHGVAALLLKCGARLRGCKRCGAAFLKKKRAEYCSPECGQLFRDRKKQQAKRGS